MEDHVLSVILADNPWMEGRLAAAWYRNHLPRTYVPRRKRLEPGSKICLITGPRQAGKSTLVWKHLLDAGRDALFLDCDEPAIREWLTSPALFLADLNRLGEKPPDLFFEEVQRLPDAGLFLKGVVDRRPGVRMFATGSSSFDLEDRTRESLAGRASRYLLLPFSLQEVSDTLQASPTTLQASPTLHEKQMKAATDRMILMGGYPTVVAAKDPVRELSSLVEAFIIRDASDRFRVSNIPAFRKLLVLLASQIGNLVNYSEYASIVGMSNDTVASYVSLLEETHVVRMVRPFVGGKRAEITRAPKAYFIDSGVRNRLFGGFGPPGSRSDQGALLENLVFSEICKTIDPILDSVRYWRTRSGAEVDFVLEHMGRLFAVEVKSRAARPTRSAHSFLRAYQPDVLLIVHQQGAPMPPMSIGRTAVRWIYPWEVGPEIRRVM